MEKELARIDKEISQSEQEEARLDGKLNNPGFVEKAPAQVVEKEREKLKGIQQRLCALRERRKELAE